MHSFDSRPKIRPCIAPLHFVHGIWYLLNLFAAAIAKLDRSEVSAEKIDGFFTLAAHGNEGVIPRKGNNGQ